MWSTWRQSLIKDLVKRTHAAIAGRPLPEQPQLTDDQLIAIEQPGIWVVMNEVTDGHELTLVAPDRIGLLATVAEMAFAGHTGVSLNIDMLCYDHNAQDWDAYNIRAAQVAVQRNELTLKALFSEEAGAVIQVPAAERDAVMQVLRAAGLSTHSHVIGSLNNSDTLEVFRDGNRIWSRPRAELGTLWSDVSYRIAMRRDNPACARCVSPARRSRPDWQPGFF